MEHAEAILIRRTLLTETSLIVHWCSQEAGLIKTVARGARSPKSPFAGRLDLFFTAHIVFVRSRRGDLHTLREAQPASRRPGLQARWERVLAASYFVQMIEAAAERETPVDDLYDLLRRALDWLEAHDPTLRAILHFEDELARALGLAGPRGTASLPALRTIIHSVPESRQRLLSAIQARP